MKGIQLSSDVIIGLNWEEKQDVKAVLRVIPINVYDVMDEGNIVLTDGRLKSYPLPSGKFAKNALVYAGYPRGKMPGADKAVIKIQFDGIPSTIAKLLFIFTAVDAEGNPRPIKKLERVPAWCATPTTAMDVIGAGGKLGEEDLAQAFGEDLLTAVPLELVHNGNDWILNTVTDGHKQYGAILEALGILVAPPPPEPPVLPPAPSPPEPPPIPPAPSRPPVEAPAKPQTEPPPYSAAKPNIKLITGQKTEIPDSEKRITVWLKADASFTPDMSAFVLDGTTHPQAIAEQLIYYNQSQGANGAVTYHPETNSLDFELERIPPDIMRIAIVLSIDEQGKHFGQAKSIFATFETSDNTYTYELEIKKDSRFLAVDMCDVYRYKGKWKFNAKGVGVNGGLEALCTLYGVEVN
jgi:stress response protein SCP2